MGGVAKAVGQGVSDVLTLGTDRIAGSPMQAFGNAAGNLVTGGTSGQPGLIPNLSNLGGSGSGAAQSGYVDPTDPAQQLAQYGGAPLLLQVASGVNVKDAVAGYFGQSAGSFDSWYNGLSASDKSSIDGIQNQLTQVQTSTQSKTEAVQKLVKDFPNFMATNIPKYSAMFDSATKGMMDQALQSVQSNKNASGLLSSGAAAAAEAQVGAQYGAASLQYGTDMAGQDWANQYSEANALLGFQQKMLGQGAQQGFSAIQSTLDREQQVNLGNTGIQNQKNIADQNSQNQMMGSIGKLGGTLLGGLVGGGPGAMMGGTIGQSVMQGASPARASQDASAGYPS